MSHRAGGTLAPDRKDREDETLGLVVQAVDPEVELVAVVEVEPI